MIDDQREINGAVMDDQRVVASCVSVRNISHKDNDSPWGICTRVSHLFPSGGVTSKMADK